MSLEKPITNLEDRGRLNQTAEDLGIRPIGETCACVLELTAQADELRNESPEHIEELIEGAHNEREFDERAKKFVEVSRNAENN